MIKLNFENPPEPNPKKQIGQKEPVASQIDADSGSFVSPEGEMDVRRFFQEKDSFDLIWFKCENYWQIPQEKSFLEIYNERLEKYHKIVNILLDSIETLAQMKSPNASHWIDFSFGNLQLILEKTSGFEPRGKFGVYDIYEKLLAMYPYMSISLEEGRLNSLKILSLIAQTETRNQAKKALDFLVQSLPAIQKNFETHEAEGSSRVYLEEREAASSALTTLFEKAEILAQEQTSKFIQGLLNDLSIVRFAVQILAEMNQEEAPQKIVDLTNRFVISTLQHHGADIDTANSWAQEWMQSPRARGRAIERNIQSFMDLEEERQGVTKRLFKEYGISEFGRYPKELLIKQIENSENKDQPYGVVFYPKDDWNGVLLGHERVFRNLLNDMEVDINSRDYLLRVYECGSKKDIAKALIELDKTYGETHKISFAIFGGHGTKDSIRFGGGESPRNQLTSKDLCHSRTQKAGTYFNKEAIIILVSCSTGQNEGIGQTLSEKFGMKVIAPNSPTNLLNIYPKFAPGKVDFDVEYTDEDAKTIYAHN
jgi:hypothetical protein